VVKPTPSGSGETRYLGGYTGWGPGEQQLLAARRVHPTGSPRVTPGKEDQRRVTALVVPQVVEVEADTARYSRSDGE